MNYYIQAIDNEGNGLIGTQNQAIVRDAKSWRKVQNRLNSFNPDKRTKQVKVYTYTNLYNESTHKLVRTILWD